MRYIFIFYLNFRPRIAKA